MSQISHLLLRRASFAYDGQALIAEYNASNALLRCYVHGPGTDEPIVWYEGSGTTDRRWLHSDERGSIVAISNGAGQVLARNSYDDYGIPASTNTGRFQYTGQTWLPELGMFYYKARIYSPTLGRFMQTDPIGYGDSLNWYAYVGNDPVNARDPSGMAELRVCTEDGWLNGAEGYDGEDKCISPHEEIVVVGNPSRDNYIIINPAIRINPGMIDYASIFSTGANGGATAAPQNEQPAKPAYCSSLEYRIGDFIDSKIGNGVKIAGGGTVFAGGAVGLATGINGVGAGAGTAIAGVGGLIYAGGTAVSTVGNGIKWLSGQNAGTTAVDLLSVPTMNLGPVSQIAVDQTVSYLVGKAVKNPCD